MIIVNRSERREEKWKFPFVMYMPQGKGEKLPLVIQLHGAGERGNGESDLSLVEVHGFSEVVQDMECECILVMPQCPSDSFWVAKIESIIEFIEQIKEEYNIDDTRIYLTGYSMGGYGTWYTAMAKPDLFAAIAPVCGGGMPWNASVLNMPVWAFHGENDTVVTPVNSEEMVDKLKALGNDVKYTKVEGIAHAVWDYAYNTQLLDWLLRNKKEER